MAAKFEIKTGAGGKLRFNLKAGNGEIIFTSETYNDKKGCLNGVESVKKNSANDARFERKVAKNGEHYFVLTATNGQTIGKSEMYKAAASMEKGIASVKKNAPEAAIVDTAGA